MTPPERSSPFEFTVVSAIVAGSIFAAAMIEYLDSPHHTPAIFGVMALLIGALSHAALTLVKRRNIHADRARVAENCYELEKKRTSRLNDENRRYFRAHMSHVPVEVMVRTLASMGGGPIRIRDVGPETEWYKVATSPQYRHLFNENDVRKLESQAHNEVVR